MKSDHLLDPIAREVGCQPHVRGYARHQNEEGKETCVKEARGELRKSVRAEQPEKTHCGHWHRAPVRTGEASDPAGVTSCLSSASSSSHLRGHARALSSPWNAPPSAFAGLVPPLTSSHISCLSESLPPGPPCQVALASSSPLYHRLEFCFLCSSCLLGPFLLMICLLPGMQAACKQGL